MSKTKTDQLRAILTTVRDIAAKADDEGRDLTAEERTVIETKMAEASTLKAAVKVDTAIAGLESDVAALEGGVKGATIDRAGTFPRSAKTLGQHFTDNPATKSWLEQIAPSGLVGEKTRVQSPPVGFAGLSAFGYGPGSGRPRGAKALITGAADASAGALIPADHVGILDEDAYARPLGLLDVITRGSTESDTVEFVRVGITGTTNAAAPVAEATSTANGTKPESTLVLEKVSTPVKTVAHWIPATRRALSDAGQIRTLVDSFLRYGLLEELEDQIANGDGTGENFTGLFNTAGVQTQVWSGNLIETARKAKTKVRTVGKAIANAYGFHPNDAEKLDLTVDLNGRYYHQDNPPQDGITRLWRLPIVESEAFEEGTGVVGDFRRMVLWDREQAAISASDSHADFFVKNLVAVLAELRAAFGVTRPAAFVTFATTGV